MCGIAGIFNQSSDEPIADDALSRMIDPLSHRGPDGRGTWTDGRTGLGHVRLAILDLRPESNQPFEIDDGELRVTYNGEIFNYLELREELERLGHRFRTTCDTEVLIRAYREWGQEAVRRFNGMWAFAIHDRKRDILFCSRDRFGIKPFNYTLDRGRFLFASEIKGILAVAPHRARPDFEALSRVVRASEGARHLATCFEGVRRLPPAHNLVVTRGGLELRRYWDYPSDAERDITPEEAERGLRERLVDAIRLRMRSDVPVGSTLSGGVDSSSIVCLLRTFNREPHETFTASYPGEPWDEAPRARQLAESLGMHPNLIAPGKEEFLPLLRQIVRHVEMPIDSDAVVPVWGIMQAARTKVTVLLEGQGADELLAGYQQSCFAHAVVDRAARLRLGEAWREFALYAHDDGWRRAMLWGGRAFAPWAVNAYRAARGDESVYAGALREASRPRIRVRNDPPIRDRLNRMLRFQHEGTLVDLLHYGDAMSMAHSVESRLPFMDYRLVEFCFRLPGDLKYRDGHGKHVLKRAVAADVPANILDTRRKIGFRTAIDRWFKDEGATTVDPALRSDACRERGVFDPAGIDRALERYRRGEIEITQNIFRWIMTELWFQELID